MKDIMAIIEIWVKSSKSEQEIETKCFVLEKHIKRIKKETEERLMNREMVTLQDCLDNYNLKGQCTILNDGKLIGFKQEEIPTQTVNQGGDE